MPDVERAAEFAARYVPNLASGITKLRDAVGLDIGCSLTKDEAWALLEGLKSIREHESSATRRGHKLFVTDDGEWVVVEAVTDERPNVRLEFRLGSSEAREVAGQLLGSAAAADVARHA
jgi:hypothetical protein